MHLLCLLSPLRHTWTHLFLPSFPFSSLSFQLCNSIMLLSPRLRTPLHVAINVKSTIKITEKNNNTQLYKRVLQRVQNKIGSPTPNSLIYLILCATHLPCSWNTMEYRTNGLVKKHILGFYVPDHLPFSG